MASILLVIALHAPHLSCGWFFIANRGSVGRPRHEWLARLGCLRHWDTTVVLNVSVKKTPPIEHHRVESERQSVDIA
jgi:hypothetical protein